MQAMLHLAVKTNRHIRGGTLLDDLYLRGNDAHTAAQGCFLGLVWGCIMQAAYIALLGLHLFYVRVQPDDVTVCLQVAFGAHKQQTPKHTCEGQVHTCTCSQPLPSDEQNSAAR